jgi:adenylate cyclase class IV
MTETQDQKEKNIEIELRSRFSLEKYNELEKFFTTHASDLGEDDRDVYFFLFPDKLLKAVHNVSKKSAKLVLKLNKIGKGSDFEEIEIPIRQEDFEKAAHMFIALETGEYMRSYQKRHNYLYKEVECALKWSELWGYHLELEIVVKDKKEKATAEEKIRFVAEELGVKIMTDQELKEFTEKAEASYKKKIR